MRNARVQEKDAVNVAVPVAVSMPGSDGIEEDVVALVRGAVPIWFCVASEQGFY